MNAKSLKILFVVLVAAMAVSSCTSVNDCAMASDEGIAKIKELVKNNVDINEYKVYRIEWVEDRDERKLENILSRISVDYIDKEDNDYTYGIPLPVAANWYSFRKKASNMNSNQWKNMCCICVPFQRITKAAGRNGAMNTNRSSDNYVRCSNSILLKKTSKRRSEEGISGQIIILCRLKPMRPVK